MHISAPVFGYINNEMSSIQL